MPKLGAEAFLYLNPEPNTDEFAQCSTCRDWVTGDNKCVIHGPHTTVTGSMSCGLYVWGPPQPEGSPTVAIVTPTESGLVDREVRCENCIYEMYEATKCGFFEALNETIPDFFEIDIDIEPRGCCNAQTSK
jgi:hypothetical protein